MFNDILLIVLNVLDKNDSFKYCSYTIKHFYKNIIHEGENGFQKNHAYTYYGYFSCKHCRRMRQ